MNWAYLFLVAMLSLALYGFAYSVYDYFSFKRKMKKEDERLAWLRACSEEDRRAMDARRKREEQRHGR